MIGDRSGENFKALNLSGLRGGQHTEPQKWLPIRDNTVRNKRLTYLTHPFYIFLRPRHVVDLVAKDKRLS